MVKTFTFYLINDKGESLEPEIEAENLEDATSLLWHIYPELENWKLESFSESDSYGIS